MNNVSTVPRDDNKQQISVVSSFRNLDIFCGEALFYCEDGGTLHVPLKYRYVSTKSYCVTFKMC